jgi:uncharacterized protein YbbC (DUF1343 family)
MLRRQFIQHAALGAFGATLGTAFGAPPPSRPPLPQSRVMLGIDALAADGFAQLRGQRAGLLTHAAGVDMRGNKTIDVLRRAPGVRLVKLFGPEHGIYGNAPANAPVQNVTDRLTGIPVFSLYGSTRRPTPEMLKGLDVLVIDLQDIGTRSYTYVSCMRYAIEACFDASVRVLVLDRPNPLGGLKVDGPGLDKKWMSYVGAYPVPYVHGLTIGELAYAAVRTPGWLKLSDAGRRNGKLDIVKMRGWKRTMRWRDTGLLWRATSPRIPNIEAVEGYPMTGLGCQLEDFSHGVRQGFNHNYLFRFIHYPKRKSLELERTLRAKRVRGLGVSPWRLRDGTEGVYLSITNWDAIRLTEANFYMMQISCQWSKANPFVALTKGQRDGFNKHTGCEEFFNDLCKRGASVDIAMWVNRWEREAKVFQNWSRQHWLYA